MEWMDEVLMSLSGWIAAIGILYPHFVLPPLERDTDIATPAQVSMCLIAAGALMLIGGVSLALAN